MNNNSNNNESVKYVSNVNALGVKVTVEALNNNEQTAQSSSKPATEHTHIPYSYRTVQQRKEALAKAGVDVSGYFAVTVGSDVEVMCRMTANGPEQVKDDDPIFKKIASQGYINVHKLFRRWIMAQMFELMESEYYWYKDVNFTDRIRRKGYEYSWKMVQNELYAQMKMLAHGDNENFNLYNLWINRKLCLAMVNDYMNNKLPAFLESLPIKHCNKYKYRQEYKTVNGTHIFVEDFEAKIYRPLRGALKELREAYWNADKLYYAFKKFNEARVELPWETPQCDEWIQAFKGNGAYWTAQNLIKFHGCKVVDERGHKLSMLQSMAVLNEMNVRYANSGEGWRLIGFLKKLMDDNNIDIAQKRAEWRAAKANRR